MVGTAKKEIQAYGLKILYSKHPSIRKIKNNFCPALHGNKVWESSLVLIDYLSRNRLQSWVRVLEIGCGWGLSGIYCAKAYRADVTAVDKDPDVFPYLKLHADINNVEIATLKKDFNSLSKDFLQDFDVMIGADICFWDETITPLRRLIKRAVNSGIGEILIADPGRPTFGAVADHFVSKEKGVLFPWRAKGHRQIAHQLLRMIT